MGSGTTILIVIIIFVIIFFIFLVLFLISSGGCDNSTSTTSTTSTATTGKEPIKSETFVTPVYGEPIGYTVGIVDTTDYEVTTGGDKVYYTAGGNKETITVDGNLKGTTGTDWFYTISPLFKNIYVYTVGGAEDSTFHVDFKGEIETTTGGYEYFYYS